MVYKDNKRFSTLWNYTTLKLFRTYERNSWCFSTLWNYTTLKRLSNSPSWFPVSVPYEITLLSNEVIRSYPVTLVSVPYEITLLSNYRFDFRQLGVFQYLMKLHYSQTEQEEKANKDGVSVPYEITLLSNCHSLITFKLCVSVPYEITLLSNEAIATSARSGFSTLWNYTTLKHRRWFKSCA